MSKIQIGFLDHSSPLVRETENAIFSTDEVRRIGSLDHAREIPFRAGRILARSMIGASIGVLPSHVPLSIDENGRPILESEEILSFNISHSRNLSVCAVSAGANISVDLEHRRTNRNFLAIAEAYFHEREIFRLRESIDDDDMIRMFYRYWTAKEAYLKGFGRTVWELGLIPELRPRNINDDSRTAALCFELPENYTLCLFSSVGIALEDIEIASLFPMPREVSMRASFSSAYDFV